MLAGGIGSVRPQNALKDPNIVQSGSYIIVMGGPAMLIGLGGGAASSAGAQSSVELDFASVQRYVNLKALITTDARSGVTNASREHI